MDKLKLSAAVLMMDCAQRSGAAAPLTYSRLDPVRVHAGILLLQPRSLCKGNVRSVILQLVVMLVHANKIWD